MIKAVFDDQLQDIIRIFDFVDEMNRAASVLYYINYLTDENKLVEGVIRILRIENKYIVGYLFKKEKQFDFKTDAIDYIWTLLKQEFEKQRI